MAWRGIGELAGDVMQRAEFAAAGSGEALNPRRGIGGDEPAGGRSPSPMRNSQGGGWAGAMGMEKAGSGQAPGSASEVVKEPSSAPRGRPVMPRLLIAGMGMTRARNAPIRRPKGVARVSPMLVLVWDADLHAAASLQR